ncbi:MAG: flagellar hook-basal body complex protein [Clostridium sp.]|uniref:flagellar hook-basal body complex protein n=1 Tax=Clostridium sp. TaxID=1506 RepID=UPI003F33F490
MGYAVTNDNNGEPATSKTPTPVSAAGLNVRFGPGSQLNGFKIVLGNIGPGTVTTLDVDKASKQLVLNGDFSSGSSINIEQIELAINKGLAGAGISQAVSVSGKPILIDKLSSPGIEGGAENTPPADISLAGATISFGEGSELNGYNFVMKHDKDMTIDSPSVSLNGNTIEITTNLLEGNIKDKNLENLQEKINDTLKASGIKQSVKLKGTINSIRNANGTLEGGANSVNPTLDPSGNWANTGLTISVGGTSAYNDYEFNVKVVADTAQDLKVTRSGKKVDVVVGKGKAVTEADLKEKIKKALGNDYDEKMLTITGTLNTSTEITETMKVKNDGKKAVAPKSVEVGKLKFEFPEGDAFNDYKIQVGTIDEDVEDKDMVKLDAATKTITISGNFAEGKVDSDKIEELIRKVTGNDKINVSGGPGRLDLSSFESEEVDGGTDLKAPGNTSVYGMDISFTAGASLNGYKIQVGKINEGKTEAVLDKKNKTIFINGDFTSGNLGDKEVQKAINKALGAAGIEQTVTVNGAPLTVGAYESTEITGGTPVQSLDQNGNLNFVDGGGELKAYDGELKSLKIPDKVRVPGPTPGEDVELRVKTYSIDKNGIITGVLEDGRVAALGQIAMASFKNPEGLTSMGGNLYSGSVNSGDAIIKSGIGTLGEDNSKGYGDNLQGMLEMSNVDLAEQFTEMIVTTRAFQASGKMITTGDEVLQDIINLKR